MGTIRLDEGWRLDDGHHFDEPPHTTPQAYPAVPPRKEKGKHMDLVPKKRNDRYLWYQNLSMQIETEAPKFGLASIEATATKTLVDQIIAGMDVTDIADNSLAGARDAEDIIEKANLAQLRAKIRNWKTLPGYPASGSEGVLQLKGAEVVFDQASFKPVIQVGIEGGKIRVGFKKLGVDAMAIYARLRGSALWERLGIDSHPPYYDTRPLSQVSSAEVREYMARGVVDDEEIGLESDIVSVTFAG